MCSSKRGIAVQYSSRIEAQKPSKMAAYYNLQP